ncbi:MAG TPA: RagB/SusD family nutrient uptake outer membrane protein [Prolixibacteraceae bacterium]|nr:RagB/SusD family nutrient uptake outer membrane protein [Prolixibacteraceae bacterium]
MKKIHSFLIIMLLILGCKESFLDTENLTSKSSENFPSTPAEADQALAGAYTILPPVIAGFPGIMFNAEAMSDDRFGGGGQNDRPPQAISYFRTTDVNLMAPVWSQYYQGIFRMNSLLKSIHLPEWESPEQRAQVVGEASFLRAFFYFDLARQFSSPEVVDGHQLTVPLVLDPVPVNNPRATEDSLYAQIAYDLKVAIDSLPADPLTPGWKAANLGRANKWAAQGLMARVFLFYTGYYQKTDLPLAGGGSITKAQVVTWIDDLVTNSGAALLEDPREMWPYTIDGENYGYVRDNELSWVGEENNTESIFEIVYTGLISSVWNEQVHYANSFNLNSGIRNPESQVPFGHGWGFLTVNPKLYDQWPNADIRKKGSIWNVDDTSEGTDEFMKGADMQWQETNFIGKKYIPVNVINDGVKENYSRRLYPGMPDNFMLNNTQNIIILRLADVYLMGAELGSARAQEYMDAIRTRAGLPSVAPTLENIQEERRYELAFEGIRYFDLLRWYGKEAGTIIKENESGATIYNMGTRTTINQDRGANYFETIDARVRNTGGFLMIPQDQIDLSEGVLTQNPGWVNAGEYMF